MAKWNDNSFLKALYFDTICVLTLGIGANFIALQLICFYGATNTTTWITLKILSIFRVVIFIVLTTSQGPRQGELEL